MRTLAAFRLDLPERYPNPQALAARVVEQVRAWLRQKGTASGDGSSIYLPDGRLATLLQNTTRSDSAIVESWVLTEPTATGSFRTRVACGHTHEKLSVVVQLAATSEIIGPAFVEVWRPRLIGDLLALSRDWRYGATPLSDKATVFRGVAGAHSLIQVIWDVSRTLPVIVISDENGAVYIRVSWTRSQVISPAWPSSPRSMSTHHGS